MKLPEERIAELEQRVAHLENIIKDSELKKAERVQPEIDRRPNNFVQNGGIDRRQDTYVQNGAINGRPPTFVQNQPNVYRKPIANQRNKEKDKEAMVGKYIIGALAAVLIFVAAISFIGLVWNQMTPEIKIFIISFAGILLSALGFWLIRTKKNAITSIILGTGAGLLFISILSANLVFHMIGNNMSIFLTGIWAVFFILSTRYTNLFFTAIISYIGSYITLILGLIYLQGDGELLMLILFASVISGIMIHITLRKSKIELISTILLSLLSYTTILIRCYVDGSFWTGRILEAYLPQIAVIILIYLLINMFYKVINNMNAIPLYLGVSLYTSIWTILFLLYFHRNYISLRLITLCLIFFAVNLIQWILNSIFYKKIEKWLTRYYAVVLAFTSLAISMELFRIPTGIILIGLLLIANEKVLKGANQSLLIGILILLDSLFLAYNTSGHLISSVYGILQLGLMGYVLWQSVDLKKYQQLNVLKTFGILVIVLNSFGISSNLINHLPIINKSRYIDVVVGYFLVFSAFLVLLNTGYFKNWKSEQFKFFGKNDTLHKDKWMHVMSYLFSTGLYFYGLVKMTSLDSLFPQLIFIMTVIGLTVTQSQMIFNDEYGNKSLIGIWIVLKYLMLTWTILRAFSALNIVSVVYSLVGLFVAVGSIMAGFKFRSKSVRLYGLILTIIMVAKFILVDLHGENSITRVFALIVGGGLCFLISFIYNKLSENYS